MTNQPAHITVGGDPFCGYMKTADAERSARALRPGFKRGRVKVVSGFCPAHRISA